MFFFSLLKKNGVETTEDNTQQPLVFSDAEEDEIITDELNDFIDNSDQPWEDVSCYRQLDILNFLTKLQTQLMQFLR